MLQIETPTAEPVEPQEKIPAGHQRERCEPGKIDGHRPIESAVVRDPDPSPGPPPGNC